MTDSRSYGKLGELLSAEELRTLDRALDIDPTNCGWSKDDHRNVLETAISYQKLAFELGRQATEEVLYARFLLDSFDLWSEDGQFTFPNGDTWERLTETDATPKGNNPP